MIRNKADSAMENFLPMELLNVFFNQLIEETRLKFYAKLTKQARELLLQISFPVGDACLETI